MRIVQLAHAPQRRGAELAALGLSRALRQHGHEAETVFLYTGPGEIGGGEAEHRLGGRESSPLETLIGFHPRLLGRLRRLLRARRPDLVQANGARTVKYGALARRADGGATWALVYRNIGDPSVWVRGHRRRLFYRRLVMPRVAAVAAVSRTTLAGLESLYGLHLPAAVIPPAVDPAALVVVRGRAEVRAELGAPAAAPVVIGVGRLSREKRWDRFLRVVARLRRELPELRAWIVGEGSERRVLERRAAAANPPLEVRLTGLRADVADLLSAADLLLLTSDSEGMPSVVLEAGYLGLPVVATDVGGMGECVFDRTTGRLAPREREDLLADACLELLRSPELRAGLAAAAGRWVRGACLVDTAVRTYLELYRRALGETAAAAEGGR